MRNPLTILIPALVGAALFLSPLAIPFASLAPSAHAQAVAVTVDPAKRYQTMTGWEVTVYVMQFDKARNRFDPHWQDYSDRILDALVDDIGVNRIRIEVRSGAENPVGYWAQFERGAITHDVMQQHFYDKANDNADPFKTNPAGFQFAEVDYQVERVLLPMAKRLAARGEKLYVNLCFVDFDKRKPQTRFNHAQNPEEYAELIAATFGHLKTKYGVVPDALEVILEPDNTARWNRSGRQMGDAAAAAMKRLTAQGFKPELILPSTKRADLTVRRFEEALQVPGVRPYVGAIAYHRYSRARPDVLRQIRDTADRYDVRVEMLEYVKGTSYHLHQDVEHADASAWQSYGMAAWAPTDGKHKKGALLYVDEATGETAPSRQGQQLLQYMRYVRWGAKRIGATVKEPKFSTVAFENTDGGQVVVVRAETKGPIIIRGLKPDRYAATFANWKSGGNVAKVTQDEGDATVTVQMPAKGIVTVFPARMAR